MSVIGIDFGNESCTVAVARAGGIETLDTSSTVAFGEKQRILGDAGKNQLVTNIRNTIWGFKRFLGRAFEDPYVQAEMKRSPFKIVRNPANGGVAVQIKYLGDERIFSMEQISAMLFTNLKETAEAAFHMEISDCVVSVPSFFTDLERRALLAAAKIAGLNVLRLLNETAATSLAYVMFKEDLPEAEDEPRNVVFVDCGHSALQVWACAFNKGKLKIIASATDPFLGGRDFDKVLADHFCSEFRSKYKIDPETDHAAYARLLSELDNVKKEMSTTAAKLPIIIEGLMDGKDVRGRICRADFEALSTSLLQRVESTLQDCLRLSNLQLDDIYAVKIVGGSTRIPFIKELIEKTFGQVPTPCEEGAVARGCVLQCALLSPLTKVREFKIVDVQPYAINIVWDESIGKGGGLEVFPLNFPFPFSRVLTFIKRDSFRFKALYASDIPSFPQKEIGEYFINNIPDGDKVKIKIKARINIDGTFNICTAQAHVSNNEEVGEGETESEPTTEQAKLVSELTVEIKNNGLSSHDVELLTEIEMKMTAQDKAKNGKKR